MKSPTEYVEAAWAEAGPLAAGQNVLKTAARAVELALADADKYRHLLAKAVRNASNTKP